MAFLPPLPLPRSYAPPRRAALRLRRGPTSALFNPFAPGKPYTPPTPKSPASSPPPIIKFLPKRTDSSSAAIKVTPSHKSDPSSKSKPSAPSASPTDSATADASTDVESLPLRLFDTPTPRRQPTSAPSFVTQAVRSVGTAVVRIDTERLVRPSATLDPLLDDPQLSKLFADPSLRPRLERGQGSGFIISPDGYLLTNAHVVRFAQKVTVTLTDGRSFKGEVKGADEYLDLAVVKVNTDGRPLPVAPMGASADLQVGDWVIAVGNPVGLDNTVTLGIVSSLNRSSSEVGIPEKRLSLIQTSASLNPGSSGGPICNQWGEVVGISTAVRANAEAIGFAIPIDVAKDVAAELAKGKPIAHAYVGIKMANLTPAFARQNNEDPNSVGIVPEIEGALVMRVAPNSPAAGAGVRRNDVIVAIDGHKVRNAKDVQAIVDRSRVGQTVTLHVLRGESSTPLQLRIKMANLSAQKKELLSKSEFPLPRFPGQLPGQFPGQRPNFGH